jgi:hypothetical protein
MSHSPNTIAAFVPNLMDRSRFGGAAVTFVTSSAAASESGAALLIVDLDRCENPSEFRIDGLNVIGFGSHVDVGSAEAAKEAGFDEVMARSAFFHRLPQILAGT